MATLTRAVTAPDTRNARCLILINLTAPAALQQGLCAGISVDHDGSRDAAGSWIDVHAIGGDGAIAAALEAIAAALEVAVVALVSLRSRRDPVIGTAVLTVLAVLLALEGDIGGLIRDAGEDSHRGARPAGHGHHGSGRLV